MGVAIGIVRCVPQVRPGHGQRHAETVGKRRLDCSSSTREAQEERERVTLLAGQRGSGIDQPGDVGIQAGLTVVFGVPFVVVAPVVLAVPGRGRA